MSKTWEDIKDNLEPLARNFYTDPYQDIQLSIAISLKRIADAMTKIPTMPNLTPEQLKELKEQWDNIEPNIIFGKR